MDAQQATEVQNHSDKSRNLKKRCQQTRKKKVARVNRATFLRLLGLGSTE